MAVVGLGYNAAEAIGIRWLAKHTDEVGRSIERLATGKKINKASDDPGGFTASESLKADQKTVLAKIERNTRESYRFAAIGGGLSVVNDLLQDLKSAVVTNANTGGLSEAERAANQLNVDSIVDTLGDLGNTVVHNGELILQPYLGGGGGGALNALRSGGKLNVVNGDLEGAQKAVDDFLRSILNTQATVGASQHSLEVENRALATQNENLSAAISQIVDTDYASEVGTLVRSQALAEAATFAIQAARSLQAETVLALIRGESAGLSSRAERGL